VQVAEKPLLFSPTTVGQPSWNAELISALRPHVTYKKSRKH
jgi:hypothetical protein